ncbi:hypothetical protein CMV_009689 [Castanea mollissima]|uniref:Uncharacterized protein n=1 Tax=Castanea mollissima TaxID=60419 RepID=A0A8J4RDZ0_9ROSI|nr:hypothetical protein CMV_009689 [Castanea mollissima]
MRRSCNQNMYFSNNSGFAILSLKTERPVWVCTAPDNWQLVIIAEGLDGEDARRRRRSEARQRRRSTEKTLAGEDAVRLDGEDARRRRCSPEKTQ